MFLGDYIIIEEQKGPYTFNCSCVSTGTGFSAEVDPDKRVFFEDHSFPNQNPSACRFLRPLGEGKIGCTIHTDSPAQCKYYRCRIAEILSPEGDQIGYVTGTLALHSEDDTLRSFWEMKIRKIPGSDPDAEEKIKSGLKRAGYLIR